MCLGVVITFVYDHETTVTVAALAHRQGFQTDNMALGFVLA